jgi:hypothetical protein
MRRRHHDASGIEPLCCFGLDRCTFAFYSAQAGGWVAEPGEFEQLAGSSAADIRARATVFAD